MAGRFVIYEEFDAEQVRKGVYDQTRVFTNCGDKRIRKVLETEDMNSLTQNELAYAVDTTDSCVWVDKDDPEIHSAALDVRIEYAEKAIEALNQNDRTGAQIALRRVWSI